jgi:hypothetical protein
MADLGEFLYRHEGHKLSFDDDFQFEDYKDFESKGEQKEMSKDRRKDNRRKNAEKKAKEQPEMYPEDVQAMLILLLSKVAILEQEKYSRPMPAQLTVKMDSLRKFRQLYAESKADNKTQLSYDPDNDTVTLRGPDVKLPEQIYTGPKKKIITMDN